VKHLPTIVLAIAFATLCGAHARAGEFCPARIAEVLSLTDKPNTYAVRLTAASPRNVTGEFLVETDRGWYRAPFPPTHSKTSVNVVLPSTAALRNVWLSEAASDDSLWGPRGVVACAPDPERHVATAKEPHPKNNDVTVAAMPIAAPFSYNCATPFAPAHLEKDVMDNDEMYAPGQFALARVDLDANGKPVDVTGIDASGGDFNLRKELEKRIMHMRFTPAVAYCKPVPSTNLLRESSLP
jgi:hypothetical protein